jgi:hypothetical protein
VRESDSIDDPERILGIQIWYSNVTGFKPVKTIIYRVSMIERKNQCGGLRNQGLSLRTDTDYY